MDIKIFDSEYKFCEILWEVEPINSTELVHLCKEKLGWSKATTYTVIRRLSERGVLKNENSIVSSLISKESAQINEVHELVDKKFGGSIPSFIATFVKSEKLSKKEYEELQALLNIEEE